MRRQRQRWNRVKINHQFHQPHQNLSILILEKNQKGKEKRLNLNILILNLRTMNRLLNHSLLKARRPITKGILLNQQEPQRSVRLSPQAKTTLLKNSPQLSILKSGEKQEFNYKIYLTIMADTNTQAAPV
jgi:hypothetical protein